MVTGIWREVDGVYVDTLEGPKKIVRLPRSKLPAGTWLLLDLVEVGTVSIPDGIHLRRGTIRSLREFLKQINKDLSTNIHLKVDEKRNSVTIIV